jgi:hypothetical protein
LRAFTVSPHLPETLQGRRIGVKTAAGATGAAGAAGAQDGMS